LTGKKNFLVLLETMHALSLVCFYEKYFIRSYFLKRSY